MLTINKYSLFTFTLTLVFIAVITSATGFAINNIEQATKLQIRASLQTILKTTVTTYQIWIQYRKRDAVELAMSSPVQAMLHGGSGTEHHQGSLAELRSFIGPVLQREKDLGFYIISPQRTNIASLRDEELHRLNLIQMQRPDYLDRAFQGETLFIPTLSSDSTDTGQVSAESAHLSIFVVSPVKQNGQVKAVLALQINLDTLFNHVSGLARLGDTGETYAFDKNGMLLTESRFEHQLVNSRLISHDSNSIMNIRITDPGGNTLLGFKPDTLPQQWPLTIMAASATQGISGSDMNGYRDYRGVPVFGAWLWDHDLGFGITSEIDVKEALASYYQTRQAILGVLTVILVMTLLLLAYVVRSQQVKKQYLQKAKDDLEQKVAVRTAELNITRMELETANRELEVLATTDSLTSLANRRCFDDHLEKEWLYCQRENKSLGILLVDIDYFKRYNDFYGHPCGDECLRNVAKALRNINVIRRPGDLIARYGGEEFAIILSAPNSAYMKDVAELLRNAVYQLKIEHQASKLTEKSVTISVGYALAVDLQKVTAETLISRADQALYKAKSLGRNQSCADDDTASRQEQTAS
ncbi:diguanylate cyclase domain-containing protein [Aliamphritea ceti]|uniref:diguanylate cyclase domain-containing protein n=1 Tax=Aliamphritea ceti TaxID=1524258 RepID=UPI0021C49174|nr:diguanylate cyclase [Aliamphritea ceti]